jgi:hypothetical protein
VDPLAGWEPGVGAPGDFDAVIHGVERNFVFFVAALRAVAFNVVLGFSVDAHVSG